MTKYIIIFFKSPQNTFNALTDCNSDSSQHKYLGQFRQHLLTKKNLICTFVGAYSLILEHPGYKEVFPHFICEIKMNSAVTLNPRM